MKFGILYNVEYHSEIHGAPAQYYEHILSQIQLEEELGFEAVWFGEHHYSGYSFGSPPVIAMAAAARTTRIRVGTGVSLVPLHHPVRLAEEYAMLDVLSQGRLEYGIGRGFIKYAYEVLGIDEEENVERYQEGTDVLVKAWTADGPFSYQGKFCQLEDHSFFPKPIQQPHPPIYAAGAVTPESYRWAGSRGFNLGTAFFIPDREAVQQGIATYREALIENGFDPAERNIAGIFQMYCGESNEEAHRHGGQHVFNYYNFFGSLAARRPHTSHTFDRHKIMLEGFSGVTYDDLDKKNLILIGDPDNLIKRIRWAEEFYGTNYILLEVAQGGMPTENVVASLKRFAKYVMPAFENGQ